MSVDTRSRILALLCDWVLPIVVVFALEVVGYVLYTRYRGQQTQVPASGENASSKQGTSKADSWKRSLRLRSECSTDLNSDADYLSSRQGSGELGGMGQDVLTHRSCSIPSRVAGLALDGVILRHSTAPPTANRHGLPTDLCDCSPPRSYSPSVSGESSNTAITYAAADLLDVLGCMRRGGYLDGKSVAPGECHSAPLEMHDTLSQALVSSASGLAEAGSPISDGRPSQRIQGEQLQQNRRSVAPWDSAAMQRDTEIQEMSAAECTQKDPDMKKREEAANMEARPLLYKALKFRQFDIASTIYLGFKHECMTIRPETFVLLIQVALSSKAFATCAEWLVELMKQSDVDVEWLDRVLAAISVGAPLVLKALIDQLEELRNLGCLSSACSACVTHASSYLAISSSQASGRVPADSASRLDAPRVVRSPPGLSLRANKLTPIGGQHAQAEPRAGLNPFAANPPRSKRLNPNAPEFVPVGPVLAEHVEEDLQQSVLAHHQLQQNIIMLLQQQQNACSDLPSPVTDISRLALPQDEPPASESQTTNMINQQQEAEKADAREQTEEDATTEVRAAGAQDARPQEPAEAPVTTEQSEQQQDNTVKETPQQEQQSAKVQLSLQKQLQQHLERALLQHGAPPGLPIRRQLRNARQGDIPATLRSESCRSPPESKDDDAASRQRIAEALISRIASRSKSVS